MMSNSLVTNPYYFLTDGGAMGQLIQTKNWSATSLGPPERWSSSLKTTLSNLLPSHFPVVLFWGPDLIQFYNDAASVNLLLGDKHPSGLGQRASKSWYELWPTVEPMINQALAGQPVGGKDVLIPVRRNDQWVDAYWTFSYSPVRDESGQVSGVWITFVETTQATLTVGKLRAQEEQLRFAVDAAELGTWDLDPLTNRFVGNARLKDWFGLSHFADIPLPAALDIVIDEDRQRVTESIMYSLNPVSGGQCDISFTLLNPATQQRRIVRARGQAYFREDDNVAVRFSGTLQDITAEVVAQQQLEKLNEDLHNSIRQFKFVTDFMPQMVWSTLSDGRQDFFNERWHEYTGLTFEQSIGKGWTTALHPDDVSRAIAVWNNSVLTGEPYEIEYRMKQHDGEYRWFLARALALRSEHDAPQPEVILRWFGTCTDIHDHKTLSTSLEQQVEERTSALQLANFDLKRSNENLERFAYVASHDLQEPLRKIQSFGDILKSNHSDNLGDGLAHLERMQNAAGRMSILIKDLLSLSRIRAQRESFRQVSLERIIQHIQSDLELVIQESDARLTVAPLPTILGDEAQLHQLFLNLISNALKFRQDSQPPHITIRSERVAAANLPLTVRPIRLADHYYCVAIADNGIGFEEKYADQIFQVFQRLHGRSQYSGTGIGLAIVQKVVENHGGAITVASQPGQGATFSVYLPG